MGRNNQQRRRAKAKARARARAQHAHQHQGEAGTAWDQDESIFSPIEAATFWWETQIAESGLIAQHRDVNRGRLLHADRRTVHRAAEVILLDQLGLLWDNGWQPVEVLHHARHELGSSAQRRLVAALISADHSRREAQVIDPRWLRQLEDAQLVRPTAAQWLADWRGSESPHTEDFIDAVVAVARALRVPRLEFLIPPPGRPDVTLHAPGNGQTGQPDPVLAKVRALLAKAESTAFDAEAATYTAKAQELITRHAVDEALVAADRAPSDAVAPGMTRVLIDPPYADAKGLLLQVVAEATRCRAIGLGRILMSAVVGRATDLAAVQTLHSSLLVQAQHALTEAARTAPPGARTRGQRYRSAFWLAYANRIRERLDEVNQRVIDEIADDRALPVLRSQADQVDAWVADRFGELVTNPVRQSYDAAGWAQGRIAGDAAKLAAGDLAKAQPALW